MLEIVSNLLLYCLLYRFIQMYAVYMTYYCLYTHCMYVYINIIMLRQHRAGTLQVDVNINTSAQIGVTVYHCMNECGRRCS